MELLVLALRPGETDLRESSSAGQLGCLGFVTDRRSRGLVCNGASLGVTLFSDVVPANIHNKQG